MIFDKQDFFEGLLTELSFRVEGGIPNLKNPKHLEVLGEIFDDMELYSVGDILIRNLLNEQDDWTKDKDGWEILDDDRAKVEKIRDYSDKEYEEETGEYFENDVTQKVAPNAFKDENDMIQKMKAAKPIFLSSEDMQNMSNTDVGDILDASEEGGKDAMLALGKERAQEYGKDWDRLEKGIASNSEVPAPMALRDKNGNLHLLAGNTRMMSFTASGKKLPVKVIDYDGEFNYEEDNQDSVETQPSEPTEEKKYFNKVLNEQDGYKHIGAGIYVSDRDVDSDGKAKAGAKKYRKDGEGESASYTPISDEEAEEIKKKQGEEGEKAADAYNKSQEKGDDGELVGDEQPEEEESKGAKVQGSDMFSHAPDVNNNNQEDDKEEKTKQKNKENREKNQRYLENTKGITSTQNINGIDGPNKENVLNGNEKVPGSPSSAVAEIGVGYGMACLSENDFDINKADECLKKKLSETKLGKLYNKPEIRKGALHGAKRELVKVGKLIEDEGLNPKTTTTGHVGGSKDSLLNTVKTLKDKGVTEVNGMPINEYEKIILEGGGGDNPTDTMVVVIDESTGKSFINHTSNKMSSADVISNGSPSKEIDEIGSIASNDYDEEQKVELEKAQQTTKDNIEKHRNDQKQYIRQQQTKMSEDAKNPEIARRAVDRLKGVKNPVSPSPTNPGKYWKSLLNHPSVKDFMKSKGYDKANLAPEQEIEIYQYYTEYMQGVDLELDRKDKGIGADDIQIITRLYGMFGKPKTNQEPLITGEDPREPIFDEDELNSYYDKQTEEINSLRERMNEIKEGSGDKAFAKRMKKRLHLDVAEGANPGGIPNNRFETVMGEYNAKDLKMDSNGNLYQKKGKDFFLVNSDGSLSEEKLDEKPQDLDYSVVGDSDTIKKCLGLDEGENIEDGIEIRVDEYDNRKAIIYNRNNEEVGVQDARSKSGPGGAMQDTISYHKDFQRCLAKQTFLMGK